MPVPEIYFVKDLSLDRYNVGRTDYPGDVFELVPIKDFEAFRKVYESLGFKLKDLTWSDE